MNNKEHDTTGLACWCGPKVIAVAGGGEVIIHRKGAGIPIAVESPL